MTIFASEIGRVVGLNNRVLKIKDLTYAETEKPKLKDVVFISSEAKHRKILEEARSAVLSNIKGK